MVNAFQDCNSFPQPPPTLTGWLLVQYLYIFCIISNNLGGWNHCTLQRRNGWEGRESGENKVRCLLEEGTGCTLYMASGCDSFWSTVPFPLWHISPGRDSEGWWHSVLLLLSTKPPENNRERTSYRTGLIRCDLFMFHWWSNKTF